MAAHRKFDVTNEADRDWISEPSIVLTRDSPPAQCRASGFAQVDWISQTRRRSFASTFDSLKPAVVILITQKDLTGTSRQKEGQW